MSHARTPESSRTLPLRARALVVLGYVCAGVLMTWPFTNYAAFATSSYGGDARLIIWTLAWDNHAVLQGLPVFDSNLFFPAAGSLRYNEHLFGVSLFTLPLAAAGASPVLAHNVVWWLALPLNGVAAFVWLRRFVGASVPAFVGSLVFMASFYVMLHVHAHLHLVWLWPLPLSMWLLDRWFDAPRWRTLALWGTVVLIGVLTSWYIAVMMALVNGLTLGGLLVTARGTANRPLMARLGALALVAVVLAVCVFPFARHYAGLRAAAGEASAFAATAGSYLVPPEHTLLGRWWMRAGFSPMPGSIWGEQTMFVGWLTLGLSAAGLLMPLRGTARAPGAGLFVALAVSGVLLSLGPEPGLPGGRAFAPFAWLTHLPGIQGMRAPARFAVVATLGLSGLTAIGASALARRGRWASPLLIGVVAPLMLAEWFVVGFPAGKPAPEDVPPIYLTPEVQSARSLVSVPDYTDTPEWFRGADYLYYSMAHWRPIVNGFGRTQPETHARLLAQVRAFPASAAGLGAQGVQYVVVHADRLPGHGEALLAAARQHPRCRLVAQRGNDYLFEILGS